MLSYIYASSISKIFPCGAKLYKILHFSIYMLVFSSKFCPFGAILYIQQPFFLMVPKTAKCSYEMVPNMNHQWAPSRDPDQRNNILKYHYRCFDHSSYTGTLYFYPTSNIRCSLCDFEPLQHTSARYHFVTTFGTIKKNGCYIFFLYQVSVLLQKVLHKLY